MTTPQKICILRLSAIGDVCHTLAVVQAIQRQYPQAQISWVIGKTEATLLQHLPDIHFIPFDKKSGWRGILSLWSQLKNQRFDVLLNLQTAFRASILSLGIRATRKIGFNRDRAREMQWLFTHEKVDITPSPHVLDGQMMFAKAIGVQDLTPKWQLILPDSALNYARQIIDPNRKTLILAPCSSKKEKDWSPERYASLAHFAHDLDMQVILVGSPSAYEQETAEYIASQAPHCINLAGKTRLTELAAVIQLADLVISSDSAPAHIATTQHTPVIGLYAIHNPRRTGPYCDQDNIISVYDHAILTSYGKPWQALPWATKAKGKEWMADISVDQVKQKMVETLGISL